MQARTKRGMLVCFGALAASLGSSASKRTTASADTVILHAKVYTVDAKNPWAEAVAIRGEKIIAVGREKAIEALRGPNTRVIDAQNRLVLPGFIDSHIHFMEGSVILPQVHLDETRNLDDIQTAVKEYATAHPGAKWVLGRGWNYSEFGDRGLPDRRELDAVVSDRPSFMEGYDGHTYWANTRALELAGITKETPNPPNGEIVRDPATGEATGALKEAAGDAVMKVIPQPTAEERLAMLKQGMALANQAGLTFVVSCGNDTPFMSDDEYFDLYDKLRQHDQLTLRFYISNYQAPPRLGTQDLETILTTQKRFAHDDEWLAGGAVKFFLDGVVESHTAAMLTPYGDDPKKFGSLRWDPELYKRAVAEVDAHGLQVFTHAIGDRAVRLALDAYEDAAKQNHTSDARHRIEHIETITAEDIPRFGKLGVIASFQPLHAYPDDDMWVWLKNAGKMREPRAFAWQSVWNSGGHEAFGSDWPVVTLNPWEGVQTAVTRQTREGTPAGGWVPEQRLSLAQAIEGYTLGAAYGVHRDHMQGSIARGKLADIIMVSQNLFEIDPHKIAETKVLLTMVGGKTVYESPELHESAAAQGAK
jgi:predicted amidohydrolase YtcJ